MGRLSDEFIGTGRRRLRAAVFALHNVVPDVSDDGAVVRGAEVEF